MTSQYQSDNTYVFEKEWRDPISLKTSKEILSLDLDDESHSYIINKYKSVERYAMMEIGKKIHDKKMKSVEDYVKSNTRCVNISIEVSNFFEEGMKISDFLYGLITHQNRDLKVLASQQTSVCLFDYLRQNTKTDYERFNYDLDYTEEYDNIAEIRYDCLKAKPDYDNLENVVFEKGTRLVTFYQCDDLEDDDVMLVDLSYDSLFKRYLHWYKLKTIIKQ